MLTVLSITNIISVSRISDGEITGENKKMESFKDCSKYIDNGAVLGFGTSKGGKMQITDWDGSKEYKTYFDEETFEEIIIFFIIIFSYNLYIRILAFLKAELQKCSIYLYINFFYHHLILCLHLSIFHKSRKRIVFYISDGEITGENKKMESFKDCSKSLL